MIGIPHRPTREFWYKVYPQVKASMRKYGIHDGERAKRITGHIWYHVLGKKKKAQFTRIAAAREARLKMP